MSFPLDFDQARGVVGELFGDAVPAIQPSALQAVTLMAAALSHDALVAVRTAAVAGVDPMPIIVGSVAVVNLVGPIVRCTSPLSRFFGATGVDEFRAQIGAAL